MAQSLPTRSAAQEDYVIVGSWMKEKNEELDAKNVPPVREHAEHTPAEFQSDVKGVIYVSRKKPWEGQVFDKLLKNRIFVKPRRFKDKAECEAAVTKLRTDMDERFEAEITKRIVENVDNLLADLPRAPPPTEAEIGTVYCHVDCKSNYEPYRAIVQRAKKGYQRACQSCNQRAEPNGKGDTATHCVQHGGGPRCKGPNKETECPYGFSVQRGKWNVYDGQCIRCFCVSNPNDERAKNARGYIHAKEQEVAKQLKNHFPDYNWTFDKTFAHRIFLVGSPIKTRFRPDACTVHGDRVIIVETDEDSHRAYFCEKEREREQSFALQNQLKIVVMIRFNPDAYTDYEHVRHPSCFSPPTKENSIVHVNPKQQKQWNARIEELVNTVRNVLDPDVELPPKQEDRPILICELFYDNVMATPEDKRVASAMRKNKAIGKRKRELGAAAGADFGGEASVASDGTGTDGAAGSSNSGGEAGPSSA